MCNSSVVGSELGKAFGGVETSLRPPKTIIETSLSERVYE